MKKTFILVACCCLTLLSTAQNTPTPSATNMESAISENGTADVVASIEGIDVSYSTTDLSGNTLMNVHFINTNETAITFSWVISKDNQRFESANSITLEPGKSFHQHGAFEVKGTSNLSDYSITIIRN